MICCSDQRAQVDVEEAHQVIAANAAGFVPQHHGCQDPSLSAYEKKRLINMETNAKMLDLLEIEAEVNSMKKKPRPTKSKVSNGI